VSLEVRLLPRRHPLLEGPKRLLALRLLRGRAGRRLHGGTDGAQLLERAEPARAEGRVDPGQRKQPDEYEHEHRAAAARFCSDFTCLNGR
jgi:hypothetical protein